MGIKVGKKKILNVDAPFCPSYCVHFNVRRASGPFVLRFEFRSQTFLFIKFVSLVLLNIVSCQVSFVLIVCLR